jgi:hypothetical protein
VQGLRLKVEGLKFKEERGKRGMRRPEVEGTRVLGY